MREERLPPREATLKSMSEITGALIGIGLVLTAVFLPMAFFGGSTGVIYRQFSITIVSAMVLSIMVALVLTPALCATLLKPITTEHDAHGRFFTAFNNGFERTRERYHSMLQSVLSRAGITMLAYMGICAILAVMFIRLPTGFLPDEDQGYFMTLISLPSGAMQDRTMAVAKQVADYIEKNEKNNVEFNFTVAGFGFYGTGQNTGIVFTRLKDFDQRKGRANSAQAITQRAFPHFLGIRDAMVFPIVPPSVSELGNSSGFDIQMEDRGNLGHAGLIQARNMLLGMAAQDPKLVGVRPASLEDTAQLHLDVDQAKADALGLSLLDVNDTLSTAWGGTFVNNFVDRGRIKRVYIQGDAPYRQSQDDLALWYVRGSSGAMAPLSAFTSAHWTQGPAVLSRYNGLPSVELNGQGAPGVSSGQALKEMDAIFQKLPKDVGYELTGLSYQEEAAGAQAPALYALSILVIFLCLAALYESWAIPLSVMMVIPLGVIGAVLAASMRGLFNDIYFQVGLLTTIGLSAKNAILIVEFAVDFERKGMKAREAALQAARMRLRPILMTSIAFIAGVSPLVVASGAGAGSQNDIGTGVVGGMVAATVLAIFFVPVFFQLINKGLQHHE
jgi:multidrug efflux pump